MNSYFAYRINTTTTIQPLSSIAICLVVGTLAALCILVLFIVLAYQRYQVNQSEQSLIVTTPSYTFYDYNRPPRLRTNGSNYGAMKQTVKPQISPDNVIEWIKTRDELLNKYAATEHIV
jgi:hypothetical protein